MPRMTATASTGCSRTAGSSYRAASRQSHQPDPGRSTPPTLQTPVARRTALRLASEFSAPGHPLRTTRGQLLRVSSPRLRDHFAARIYEIASTVVEPNGPTLAGFAGSSCFMASGIRRTSVKGKLRRFSPRWRRRTGGGFDSESGAERVVVSQSGCARHGGRMVCRCRACAPAGATAGRADAGRSACAVAGAAWDSGLMASP